MSELAKGDKCIVMCVLEEARVVRVWEWDHLTVHIHDEENYQKRIKELPKRSKVSPDGWLPEVGFYWKWCFEVPDLPEDQINGMNINSFELVPLSRRFAGPIKEAKK